MKMEMGLVVLTVTVTAVLFSGASAQSDCTNVLISMSPCLNYITGNSSTPSQQCCGQLGNVVRSSPECLCQVLNGGGSQLGLNINQTQALALPRACNVQTPPASRCNGGGSSSGSPAGSPNTTSGKGDGSNTVPTTGGDGSSSDGSSMKLSSPLFTFLLAASYVAVFTPY